MHRHKIILFVQDFIQTKKASSDFQGSDLNTIRAGLDQIGLKYNLVPQIHYDLRDDSGKPIPKTTTHSISTGISQIGLVLVTLGTQNDASHALFILISTLNVN